VSGIKHAVRFFQRLSGTQSGNQHIQDICRLAGTTIGFADGAAGRASSLDAVIVVLPNVGATAFAVAYRAGYLAGLDRRQEMA